MSVSDREHNKPQAHYTAVIEIHYVVPEQITRNSYGDEKKVAKETREITRLIIRGPDLEGLIEKASQHLDLVED